MHTQFLLASLLLSCTGDENPSDDPSDKTEGEGDVDTDADTDADADADTDTDTDVDVYAGPMLTRANAAGTGVFPGPAPAGGGAGSIAWSVALPSGYGQQPFVAGGVVYTGAFGIVHAFDAFTGDELWTAKAPEDDVFMFAVEDSILFLSSLGEIVALSGEDGHLLWQYSSGVDLVADPIVADGVMYASGQGSDGPVFALSATSGSVLWSSAHGCRATGSPAFVDGTLYYGCYSADDHEAAYYAVNADNGAILWQTSLDSDGDWGPVVSGNALYVDGQNGLYALSLQTQEVILESPYSCNSAPAIDEVITCLSGAGVFSVDIENGEYIWGMDLGSDRAPSMSPEGYVYLVDEAGSLHAFDGEEGTELWSYSIGEGYSPVVVDGLIYAVGNGYLWALE